MKVCSLLRQETSSTSLFLLASGAVEGVGDGLAGIAEALLSRVENATTLLLSGVAS